MRQARIPSTEILGHPWLSRVRTAHRRSRRARSHSDRPAPRTIQRSSRASGDPPDRAIRVGGPSRCLRIGRITARCGRWPSCRGRSNRSSPSGASRMAAAWDELAGPSSAPWRGFTSSGACEFATIVRPTFIKASSRSASLSSAGDDTSVGFVRGSNARANVAVPSPEQRKTGTLAQVPEIGVHPARHTNESR